MFSLIKWEIRKNLRPGVLIIWALGLALGFHIVFTNFGINEAYAAVFSKYYGIAPIMGLAMFTMFSGSFVREYSSNVDGLIKASKNGKKQLVLAKFIANGICASIINLSILMLMVGRVMFTFKLDGLNLPLKSLWYFGNSGSNITILQMLLIVSLTIILGSFLFASIGLYFSSLSKKAAMPFIFGGLTMGIPYLIEFIFRKNVIVNLPLSGMYSQQLIRYAAPVGYWVAFIGIALILPVVLYNLTKKRFLKEI
ncbi:ABC transporter permease [Clostridium baratii]|uniref:ABC transporter permease n=1 Tax=Clostridium baratii TaxID=1561 RepID=UPI0030D39659